MNVLRISGLAAMLAVGCGMAMAQAAGNGAAQGGGAAGNGAAQTVTTNKTKSNVKNNVAPAKDTVKVKSHSNSTNNKTASGGAVSAGTDAKKSSSTLP